MAKNTLRKLSVLTTDEAADVLCEITPYVSNIVSDGELLSELKNAISPKDVKTKAEWMALGVEKIAKLVPIVLKKRKNDVYGILGVLSNKTVEEIGKQNFILTMKQIRDVGKDKDLLDFFKSCVDSEGDE